MISVMNTYAWIQATADSKTVKIKGAGMAKGTMMLGRANKEFPSRVISRCPAIRLAVSRTQSVIGRIRFLVNSINTMKDIRAFGVPCGTKCASMWFVFLTHPNKTMASQKVRESGRVVVKWEVAENVCGYRAIKFNVMITRNVVVTRAVTPFSLFFIVKEISLNRINKILDFKVLRGKEFFQWAGLEARAPRGRTSQAQDMKVEAGSNIENRFIIILCFLGFWFFLLRFAEL